LLVIFYLYIHFAIKLGPDEVWIHFTFQQTSNIVFNIATSLLHRSLVKGGMLLRYLTIYINILCQADSKVFAIRTSSLYHISYLAQPFPLPSIDKHLPYGILYLTALTLTISSGFNHTTYAFCLIQSLLSGHNSRSKCHRTLAKMIRISWYARLKAGQLDV
jgi:hypothetical protein